MRRRHYSYRTTRTYRGGGISIFGLLFFVFFTFILFRIIGGLYSFLWGLIPIMLILTLIINRKAINRYIDSIRERFAQNAGLGIASVAMTAIGLPFVSVYLLYKAITTRGQEIDAPSDSYGRDYIPFEEVKEKKSKAKSKETDEYLDLPPLDELERQVENRSERKWR